VTTPGSANDGLIRPLNAPAGQQTLPGVQPGSTGGVTLAQFVIIFGAAGTPQAGGLFIYSGSPGPGNGPIFSFTSASEDPYGNLLGPGIFAGKFGGVQAGFDLEGGFGQVVVPTGNPLEQKAGGMAGAFNGTTGFTQVFSPQNLGPLDDRVFLTLFGDAGASALWQLVYNAAVSGAADVQAQGDFTGISLNLVSQLFGVLPGTGTSNTSPAQQETWHQATPLTGTWAGGGGGVNGLFYRLLPIGAGLVEVIGDILNTTATGNSNVFTLPAGYRPTGTPQNHPAGWNDPLASNSPSVPWISYQTSGVVQVTGIEVANKEIFFHHFIPLGAL
jgi:hypothetical protein